MRAGPESEVIVRGSKFQVVVTFGATISILVCTFFVGGIWYKFNEYTEQQDKMAAQLLTIDRRLIRIEAIADAGRHQPAPRTDGG